MTTDIQELTTINFMVPASGGTAVAAVPLPDTDIGGADGYTIDWKSLSAFLKGKLFIPQAVTIDALDVDPSITLTFLIPTIQFRRQVTGGDIITFQFPAVQDLVTSIEPSSGSPDFRTFWYDYPAFPDCCGKAAAVALAAILMESGAAAKISGMSAAGALTGAELVPAVQGGVNVQTTTGAIAALTPSGMTTSGSNATSAALDNIAGAASNTFVAAQTMPALHTSGTAGAGYVDLKDQGSPQEPADPADGVRMFANGNRLGLINGASSSIRIAWPASLILQDYVMPQAGGTLIGSGDTGTVTNTMLAGSIANAKLTNSSITVAGHSISLGGSQAIAIDDLSDVTIASIADNDILVYSAGSSAFINVKPSYSIAISAPQTTAFTANQVIGHHRFAAAVSFAANFGSYLGLSSEAGGSANATGSTVFSVEKAATATPNTFSQIGTITFAAGTVTPTFATSSGSAQTFAAGDVLRIVAPGTPDATFAGFYCTLIAART